MESSFDIRAVYVQSKHGSSLQALKTGFGNFPKVGRDRDETMAWSGVTSNATCKPL